MKRSLVRPVSILLKSLLAVLLFALPAKTQASAETGDEPVAQAGSPSYATVAHRGASAYAPENTMAAFKKAAAMEVDYIEFDVQMTKDGQLVVIHDSTVDRTTDGEGSVGEMTYDQLRQLDAGSWFNAAYQGEKIPALREVLDAFGGRVGMLLELKRPAQYPGIELKLAMELKQRHLDMPKKHAGVIVQSFDTESLKEVRTLMPHIPVAVLVANARKLTASTLLDYRRYADAVHPKLTGLNRPLVERIRSFGLNVMGWTARNDWNAAALDHAGVDGVIADDPAIVRSYIRAHARRTPAARSAEKPYAIQERIQRDPMGD